MSPTLLQLYLVAPSLDDSEPTLAKAYSRGSALAKSLLSWIRSGEKPTLANLAYMGALPLLI